MPLQNTEDWLSQTENEMAESAILIGDVDPKVITKEVSCFSKGILIICSSEHEKSLPANRKIHFCSIEKSNTELSEAIGLFVRIDQESTPVVKCAHVVDQKKAFRTLKTVELVHSIIASNLRARKTREETGFVRQNHIFGNLSGYMENRIPNEWKNSAEGTVAAVIGAGTSLDTTLTLLLKIEKPLIVSTDSGLSSLLAIGVDPDYVLNIDPEKSFESCCNRRFEHKTLILSSQSHKSWQEKWTGEVRFISGRVITEDWLSEKGIGKTPVIAENNVGLTALSFTNFLSPSAVILFGMDLSNDGQGEKRYARLGGRDHIEIHTSQYHKIPGNFSEFVSTPFLSDWQETSDICEKISKERPIINLNDRGATLAGADLLHPEDFNQVESTLKTNFKAYITSTNFVGIKRGISVIGKNQITYELARCCDKIWSTLHDQTEKDLIKRIRDLMADKDIASMLGDFTFSIFPILLSEKQLEAEERNRIYNELCTLIWKLEDEILKINSSDDFIRQFLTGTID